MHQKMNKETWNKLSKAFWKIAIAECLIAFFIAMFGGAIILNKPGPSLLIASIALFCLIMVFILRSIFESIKGK